jgi:hypothetical protein
MELCLLTDASLTACVNVPELSDVAEKLTGADFVDYDCGRIEWSGSQPRTIHRHASCPPLYVRNRADRFVVRETLYSELYRRHLFDRHRLVWARLSPVAGFSLAHFSLGTSTASDGVRTDLLSS